MITAAECRAIVPGLTERVLGGKLCPTDGIANPMCDASLRTSRRPPGRADQDQHTGHRFAYERFNRLRGDHPKR